MHSLFRLLAPARTAAKPPAIQRDSIPFVLADGRRIDVLRVRDPRARRIKLSFDERGARLSLPLRASLVAGERFLHEHRDWLTTHVAAQAHHAGEGLCRDATTQLPLRGVELPLHWQAGRATRLDVDGDGLLFTAPASAGDAALQRALRDFYEAQARADIGRWRRTPPWRWTCRWCWRGRPRSNTCWSTNSATCCTPTIRAGSGARSKRASRHGARNGRISAPTGGR